MVGRKEANERKWSPALGFPRGLPVELGGLVYMCFKRRTRRVGGSVGCNFRGGGWKDGMFWDGCSRLRLGE